MKRVPKRICSTLLTAALCSSLVIPASFAAETDYSCEDIGPTAYSAALLSTTKGTWVNYSLDAEEMESLLNSQELYPQITGWTELDTLVGEIVEEHKLDDTTYGKMKGVYDWMVQGGLTYDWDGYTYFPASLECYNSFTYDYLADMSYPDGLEKSIPDDVANHAYHILYTGHGVCYDYACAWVVIARYIGVNAYFEMGQFDMEYDDLTGHHGWTVLEIGGERYVFDPQRDARNYEYNNGTSGYYFGIPEETANTLRWHYDSDGDANVLREKAMLPVEADRVNAPGWFMDVAPSDYFRESAIWAFEEGIAAGTAYGVLSPRSECTRAQVVTFLWRAAGEPEPNDTETGFTDVPEDAYYAEAVAWAVENDITEGTSDTTFSPYETCTRAQTVSFLYRSNGSPAAETDITFTDVSADAYYADAVAWAVENGITYGTTETTFSPDDSCTRAQVITFLYRDSSNG